MNEGATRFCPLAAALMLGVLALTFAPLGCAEARDPVERRAQSVRATGTTKTKIPIRVHGSATTEPGEPVGVEIALEALAATDALEVEFKPGDGVEILAGGEAVSYGPWAIGDGALETLTIVSEQPGTAYVFVHVRGRFEGYDRGAAYGIKIEVGEVPEAAQLADDASVVIDDEGQRLIQVPGERR